MITRKLRELSFVPIGVSRVDTPMGTQAPMGTHLYIYDYQIKSTAFFNISSELHSSSSIYSSYLQGFISTELHSVRRVPQTNK